MSEIKFAWPTRLVLAVPMALLAIVLRADEKDGNKTNDQFTVKLTDGSSIICKPKLDSLPFKTSFAEINIPLQTVEALTLDHNANVVTLSLLNGDRLQGQCLLADMAVVSMLGDLKIPLTHIAEVITTLKREPVFKDTPQRRNACINNLRQIDSGKEQWALANRIGDNEQADISGVNEYIKGNRTPICPAGGTYTYNAMGADPECSVPGHALR